MNQDTSPHGMAAVLGLCGVIGVITVAATIAWGRGAFVPARIPAGATEEYGKRLMVQTTEFLGSDVADPKMRYTRSRLACASCHSLEPGNLSLVATFSHYPAISARSGANETLQDRINECMTRSMNGRPLGGGSPEMIAMVAWLKFLEDRDAATGASQRQAHEPPAFETPRRAADPESGQRVFEKRCAACHGKDGAGLRAAPDLIHGFVFPPLWGPDSFNDGAGMHRVLTAAKFIKARMPLGRADLDDDQAFDVAAYVNSKPRPEMAGLDRDYPDRSKKPVDTSYGPYADAFPAEQHHFGPFQPIEAYYKKLQKPSK